MNQNIFVAGATGRTGRIIIRKLVQNGIQPHVLVRDLPSAKALLGENVFYHLGDVRDFESLITPMQSVDAVISAVGAQAPVGKNCPKRVDFEGVANLVKAARGQHIQRFILVSSIAVTHKNHPLNCFGKVLDWKLKGEAILRDSGLDYVIIRPGGLTDTQGGKQGLLIDQGDRIMGTISREDVAELCLVALQYPHELRATFEVIEADQKMSSEWRNFLPGLVPDPVFEN